MKKIVLFFLLLCGSLPLQAYPTHPHNLQQPVQTLYRLEETKQLLSTAEKDGAINIRTASLGYEGSNAAWMASERTIYLNFSKPRTQGSLIASIVFELHNALSSREFAYYDHLAEKRQLSREKYIEAVERLEYANAHKTAHMLYKGVRTGVFPSDAFWCIAPTFEEHYQVQIQAGHSGLIGCIYDDIIRTTSGSLVSK